MTVMDQSFDYIIVGAGVSGAVLAARLPRAIVDWDGRCTADIPDSVHGVPILFAQLFERLAAAGRRGMESLRRRLLVATKPAVAAPFVGTLDDLVRSKPARVLENALLRQQLVILQRSVKRPRCTPTDRALLVLLTSPCWPLGSSGLVFSNSRVIREQRAASIRLSGRAALERFRLLQTNPEEGYSCSARGGRRGHPWLLATASKHTREEREIPRFSAASSQDHADGGCEAACLSC